MEGLTKRTMKSTATMLFATCPGNRQTLHSPVAFGATICPSYNPLKLNVYHKKSAPDGGLKNK